MELGGTDVEVGGCYAQGEVCVDAGGGGAAGGGLGGYAADGRGLEEVVWAD